MNEPSPTPVSAEAPVNAWLIVRQSMQGFRRKPLETLRRFLGETIWQWDLTRLTRGQRLGAQFLRMIYLVGRAFVAQRAQLQAMALTYTTMLALVPAFAIVVAMFSVQGLRDVRGRIEGFIVEFLAASSEQQVRISSYLHEQADQVTQNGGVAGIAFLVFLFLTVVSLLGTLERTLNQVWGVRKQRGFLSKFVTYWCVATLGPIFLGLALVHGSQIEQGMKDIARSPPPIEEEQPPSEEDLFGFTGVGGALSAAPEQDLESSLRGTKRAPG
ncbi:MAG: YihY family inner membrane protein, partial [Planctomycetes bacterium]|nr:YihY family inner membrane protein [Planctomycetota bacterium]